jgi:hypothetical protein
VAIEIDCSPIEGTPEQIGEFVYQTPEIFLAPSECVEGSHFQVISGAMGRIFARNKDTSGAGFDII